MNNLKQYQRAWRQKDWQKSIDKNAFQVFVLSSNVPWPAAFAHHFWFVLNCNGVVERWEFGKFRGSPHPNDIGILKDFLPPDTGMNKWGCSSRKRFDIKLHWVEEGDEDSLAARLAYFIRRESPAYPLRHTYRYLGPNSNTYIQWVLNHFPELSYQLPWPAIGKNYKF